MRLPLHSAVLTALIFTASPVVAQEERQPAYSGSYNGDRSSYEERDARDAWLADCRQRLSSRDSGVGGALIGGAVGGLAGNRLAGRGNRTVGTLAGAAVGAAAGAVIDKAEDSGRNRDECEAYLDDYYARYRGAGYPQQGYYPSYGYMAQPTAIAVPRSEPNCTETVEYVYEDVPIRPARRVIPRRSKIVPDKRVPIK